MTYFNKFKIEQPHGIMFHHFHSKKHSKSQGSISRNEFEKIINFVGVNNILSPHEFEYKLNKKKLKKNECCITFDDNLKSQYDIALPILEKYNLTAFWFIYTAPLKNRFIFYESFRVFINSKFKNFDSFFHFFQSIFEDKFKINIFKILSNEFILEKQKIHPMYSKNDIIFRYIRDLFFDEKKFMLFGIKLMEQKKFKYKDISKKIFLDKLEIKKLSKKNHYIGLHSYSHPMKMEFKNYQFQNLEYQKNYDDIFNITKISPISGSFPSNSYNNETLKIFKKLGIKISFRANMLKSNSKYKNLLIPRQNHALINRFLKQV